MEIVNVPTIGGSACKHTCTRTHVITWRAMMLASGPWLLLQQRRLCEGINIRSCCKQKLFVTAFNVVQGGLGLVVRNGSTALSRYLSFPLFSPPPLINYITPLPLSIPKINFMTNLVLWFYTCFCGFCGFTPTWSFTRVLWLFRQYTNFKFYTNLANLHAAVGGDSLPGRVPARPCRGGAHHPRCRGRLEFSGQGQPGRAQVFRQSRRWSCASCIRLHDPHGSWRQNSKGKPHFDTHCVYVFSVRMCG